MNFDLHRRVNVRKVKQFGRLDADRRVIRVHRLATAQDEPVTLRPSESGQRHRGGVGVASFKSGVANENRLVGAHPQAMAQRGFGLIRAETSHRDLAAERSFDAQRFLDGKLVVRVHHQVHTFGGDPHAVARHANHRLSVRYLLYKNKDIHIHLPFFTQCVRL